MNARTTIATAAVAASGAGIIVQIAAHVTYPTVPPGLIIVAVAAAITGLVRSRWAPLAAVVSGAGTLVGGLANSGWRDRLSGIGGLAQISGTWLQVAAGAVALVAGVAALRYSAARRTALA
jgi:hypothetical protein